MNLISFDYNSSIVRTQVTDDGEPLFCLVDICKVLELNGTENTARQLKEEFETPVLNTGVIQREAFSKGAVLNTDPLRTIRVKTAGGTQNLIFITEPQLYFVMMRSRSDKAKPFRQWVVNEVLPSIRKTGRYEASKTAPTAIPLKDLIEVTKLVLEPAGIKGNQLTLALDKVVKKKTGESVLALSGVQLKAPQQEHLVIPSDLGKQVGLSARKINILLEEAGLQCKDINDRWTPTQKGLDLGAVLLDVGKAHSSGTPIRQLKWPMSVLGSIKQLLKEEE